MMVNAPSPTINKIINIDDVGFLQSRQELSIIQSKLSY